MLISALNFSDFCTIFEAIIAVHLVEGNTASVQTAKSSLVFGVIMIA